MSYPHKEKAPVKKSAFVQKLFLMLSEPKLAGVIWWTRGDTEGTFALLPGAEFLSCLTDYFKHGNISSFVRQLHMYGFHKVSDSQTSTTGPYESGLGSTRLDQPVWEFKHLSGRFRKGDEESLKYIRRRTSNSNGYDDREKRLSQGYSSQGYQHRYPQGYPHEYAPAYAPLPYPHPGYPQQPYPPTGYLPNTYPSQPYPPQGYQQSPLRYTPHTYPPQAYPPQAYPPQSYPPQPYPSQTHPHQAFTPEVRFYGPPRNRFPSVLIDPLAPSPHHLGAEMTSEARLPPSRLPVARIQALHRPRPTSLPVVAEWGPSEGHPRALLPHIEELHSQFRPSLGHLLGNTSTSGSLSTTSSSIFSKSSVSSIGTVLPSVCERGSISQLLNSKEDDTANPPKGPVASEAVSVPDPLTPSKTNEPEEERDKWEAPRLELNLRKRSSTEADGIEHPTLVDLANSLALFKRKHPHSSLSGAPKTTPEANK